MTTPWHRRELVRVYWLVLGPPLCVLWFALGFVSLHRLGKVLERTGLNLQTYDW